MQTYIGFDPPLYIAFSPEPAKIDPGRAWMIGVVRDCQGMPARNLTVTGMPMEDGTYVAPTLAWNIVSHTPETTPDGSFSAVGLPAGPVEIIARDLTEPLRAVLAVQRLRRHEPTLPPASDDLSGRTATTKSGSPARHQATRRHPAKKQITVHANLIMTGLTRLFINLM